MLIILILYVDVIDKAFISNIKELDNSYRIINDTIQFFLEYSRPSPNISNKLNNHTSHIVTANLLNRILSQQKIQQTLQHSNPIHTFLQLRMDPADERLRIVDVSFVDAVAAD